MIENYINTHAVKKIQLGCGGNFLDGWLNTDVTLYSQDAVYMDVTKPFPIADSTFDFVYSEHTIEHIPYWGGLHMLTESYRILKPGGKIRVSCPDIQFLIDLYTNPTELSKQYVKETKPDWAPYADPIFTFNNYMRDWGHTFIYNKQSLINIIEAAGFVDVTEHKVRESNVPEFQNLEADWRMPAGFLQMETMTFEAVKSA